MSAGVVNLIGSDIEVDEGLWFDWFLESLQLKTFHPLQHIPEEMDT